MSRTRRTALSLATGVGGSAVTLAVGLLATPLLLHWIGDEKIGTHRVATEWLGYLTMLDFGLTGVLQVAVVKRLGHNDLPRALADVRRAMRLFVRVAGLQLLLLAGFGAAAAGLIADLSSDTVYELRWGLAVASVAFLLTPFAALRPLLEGGQQSYLVNLALLAQSLGVTGACVVFAWCGWGLVGQFAATLVGSLVYYAFLVWRVRRLYPNLWRVGDRAEADAFPVAWPMFVFNLVGRLSTLSDSLILGSLLGPLAVVRFAVTQRLMMVVVTQVQGLGNSTWAALSDLHHRGEAERLRHRFLQLNRWTSILAVAGLGPLAVLNEPLVSLWVGRERYAGDLLSWVTCAQGALLAQIALWAWPLVGIGQVRMVLPVMLVGSTVNLIISVAGTHAFWEIGPAAGTVAGYLGVYYWWFPRLLSRTFGLSVWSVMGHLPAAVAAFIPIGLGLAAVEAVLPLRWTDTRVLDFLGWGVLAAGAGVLYLACVWRLLTPVAERRALLGRLKRRTL